MYLMERTGGEFFEIKQSQMGISQMFSYLDLDFGNPKDFDRTWQWKKNRNIYVSLFSDNSICD